MSLLVLPEGSDVEQIVSAKNRLRQYDFLEDSFRVWQAGHGFKVDRRFMCELNFYAVQYLSPSPGITRDITQGNVTVGQYVPPQWHEVDAHLDQFFAKLEEMQGSSCGPIDIAAYALWRTNWIHPFVQGNGRTARALSYFVLCQKLGYWPPGQTIPERIRSTRQEYCDLLMGADASAKPDGTTNLGPLADYLSRLLTRQLS